ncbi:MAG TPA: HAMP domain-containing sensor histidine kinase [Burkholderiaceae bacterium]|nr:HAMP domain-containing sensor histidine kinase [Burkholderiaceae bacterium]
MKLRLPGRVPFRLRFFFRGAFALLALATVALALTVLVDEKQRSHRRYAEGLHNNLAQIAARLRHPTGQLALLNPELADQAPTPLHPLVLPFAAIDFDDRVKSLQAIEMAGCQVQYPDASNWCAGVGNNPYAGAFVYLIGSVALGELVSHPSGELDLTGFHRVRVELAMRGQTFRWIAPFEALDDGSNGSAGRRGRLTGYIDENQPIAPGTRPVRDFRGWLWQEGRCLERDADPALCVKRSFVSIRLPIEIFRDDLFQKKLVWPPADLAQMRLRLQLFAPGDGPALFDTNSEGATVPFSLGELRALLASGEQLRVRKLAAGAGPAAAVELLSLQGAADTGEPVSPWLSQLIRQLPVDGFDAPVVARDTIATPLGRYELVLSGDVRSVNRGLATVATRLSWFVVAMLLAIALTWLAIELRIIRRITLLTRRAASVSIGVRGRDDLAGIDLADLRGSDELGVLAQGLRDLLRRVNDDVRREQIRAEQEKDMWHAVGHEIMSPLQSLMALHGSADDASRRYVTRMQQAVKVLYGHASPSEALQSTTLQLAPIDLSAFLGNVARNAPYTGIEHVVFASPGRSVAVRAEEYALEDVVTHVLRNADRYRSAGSPIRIELDDAGSEARVHIHNDGPAIPPGLIDTIFEYGVSDAAPADAQGHRGQGLFVAKTYMAKMGGTIAAENLAGGVRFTLGLPKALPS